VLWVTRKYHTVVIMQCLQCKGKFFNARSLKRHSITYHTPVKCPTCFISLPGKLELKAHSQTLHPNVECSFCPKSFSRNTIWQHIHQCHNTTVHVCPVCTKQLSSAKCLKSHILWHHTPKNVKCIVCDDYFCTIKHMHMHRDSKHIPNVPHIPVLVYDFRSPIEQYNLTQAQMNALS